MDPHHCLRGLYTKDGVSNIYLFENRDKKNFFSLVVVVGSQKLKILKSSETSKSAFFSFAGGVHMYLVKTEIKKSTFFSLMGGQLSFDFQATSELVKKSQQ